jgi:peptide/nickel transport system substrate-binding protein
VPRPAQLAPLFLAAGLCACRQAQAPQTARHIIIAQLAAAVTLDPHGSDNSHTSNALSHFYEPLVAFGPEMDLKPLLAERWENPSDTVWRFHLRKGVVFHDGRPFGAEDAATSLRRALAPESHLRYYVEAIAEIRVVDDLTLELLTRHPAPVLLNNLVFIPIVPRGSGPDVITQPVGTGPYRFVGGRPGGVIVGQRFEKYWGPPPAFERVTLQPIPDAKQRAGAVASGRADIASWFPSQYWEEGRKQPGVRLVSRQGLAAVYLGFSLRAQSPFSDRRLRLAVALALDRARIVRDAMSNLGAPLEQLVPPSVAGYSSGLTPVMRDRDRALALLKAAGLGDAEIPLLSADSNAEVAQEVARQLQEIGLHVKLSVLPQMEFYDRWTREEMTLCVFGWASTTGDASGSFEPLIHSPGDGFGRFNRWGYANPRLDRLIEESAQALAPEERRDPLTMAAQIVQEDLPVIPLVLRYDLYAVRKDLDWRPRLDRHVSAFDVKPLPGAAQR